ncbi:MAG: phage tail tape measure protein, partial [Oscillospiraceae bacterium]|nr:phage tail tape measure protein [Oscillospiraceae bacterium]
GGGIKGAAAAVMEGVKGNFSTAYNFLDNLTGGKISEIKDKFVQGIQGMKTAITDKFAEFKESGRKLIQTFTDGIMSVITAPVEAVKGGLQKIRNMLPFSDAKTGPLSTLTLSGQRTMTTYAHGLTLAENAPAEAVESGLQRTAVSLERKPANVVRTDSSEDGDGDADTSGKRSITIQKLIYNVDFKNLKDLPQLLAMLQEMQDAIIANGGTIDTTTALEPV